MANTEHKKIKKSYGFKAGDKLGNWELQHVLGEGGNGVVWEVKNPCGHPYALKMLHKADSVARDRFQIEIAALESIGHIPGIVPLVESHKLAIFAHPPKNVKSATDKLKNIP